MKRSLVRPFDATSLIEHVRGALATSDDQRLRDQSLRFVFNLQRSRPYGGPPALRDVGLQLRTATGWTPASRAVFGNGWPGTAGDDLAIIVAEGASSDSDLAYMEACMIAPPESLVRKGETVEEWMQFLQDHRRTRRAANPRNPQHRTGHRRPVPHRRRARQSGEGLVRGRRAMAAAPATSVTARSKPGHALRRHADAPACQDRA